MLGTVVLANDEWFWRAVNAAIPLRQAARGGLDLFGAFSWRERPCGESPQAASYYPLARFLQRLL